MSKDYKNLFKWSDLEDKKKRCDQESTEYWQKRTAKAANEAVRCATHNTSSNRSDLVDDDVNKEAQQLVRGWLTEQRVYGAHHDRDSFMRLSSDEMELLRQPSLIEVHKEWEHLLSKLETKQGYKDEIAVLMETDDKDKGKQLQTVISNLHKKSFVKKSQLRLVDSPKQIDVGKKMEIRQEQVKKNREDRMRNDEVHRLEKLAEKEARVEAKKMLKEESQQKEIAKKREEELIQMEMRKIRAEIQKQRDNESRERERVQMTQRVQSARDLQMNSGKQITVAEKLADGSQQRFQIISEIVERRFMNKNLTRLRRYFQLWREQVSRKSIEMTKAAVWNDWQVLRKAFRVWRRDARLAGINRQIDVDQHRMRSNLRKEEIALTFWKRTMLKKCLIRWSLFVVDEKETKWFLKLEDMRKRKMAMYIDALQEKAKENQKRLNSLALGKGESDIKSLSEDGNLVLNESGTVTERKNSKTGPLFNDKRSCSSARSRKIPHEAWQVTKKHVNLPLEELVDDPNKYIQESIQSKALRPPKIVDTFASRNAAQKELIEQQRSKLQEQERLINDLVSANVISKVTGGHAPSSRYNSSEIERVRSSSIGDCVIEETITATKDPLPNKTNKFVTQMEERAKERERIKNERLDKQKRQDEEKRKMLAEQLAEQCKHEAEEKQKREQMLKEKREKEKLNADASKKKLQMEQEQNRKADEFFRSILMKRYGIARWKQLVEMKERYWRCAIEHHGMRMMKKVFAAWFEDVKRHSKEQNEMIFSFHSKMLLRRCLHHFSLHKQRLQIMEKVALDHRDNALIKKHFQIWRVSNHRAQIRLDKLEIQSVKLYEGILLRTHFCAWRQLPVASRLERERERRKEVMRQKVAGIIPDFRPIHNENL